MRVIGVKEGDKGDMDDHMLHIVTIHKSFITFQNL